MIFKKKVQQLYLYHFEEIKRIISCHFQTPPDAFQQTARYPAVAKLTNFYFQSASFASLLVAHALYPSTSQVPRPYGSVEEPIQNSSRFFLQF